MRVYGGFCFACSFPVNSLLRRRNSRFLGRTAVKNSLFFCLLFRENRENPAWQKHPGEPGKFLAAFRSGATPYIAMELNRIAAPGPCHHSTPAVAEFHIAWRARDRGISEATIQESVTKAYCGDANSAFSVKCESTCSSLNLDLDAVQ